MMYLDSGDSDGGALRNDNDFNSYVLIFTLALPPDIPTLRVERSNVPESTS